MAALQLVVLIVYFGFGTEKVSGTNHSVGWIAIIALVAAYVAFNHALPVLL
eukprot:SAG31_NODE_84_length_27014_cov_3.743006_5_plen_51_part_00